VQRQSVSSLTPPGLVRCPSRPRRAPRLPPNQLGASRWPELSGPRGGYDESSRSRRHCTDRQDLRTCGLLAEANQRWKLQADVTSTTTC